MSEHSKRMRVLEADRNNAHYFAFGVLTIHYKLNVGDWENLFNLCTGYSYFYTENMSLGMPGAWNAYVELLTAIHFLAPK